MRMKHYIYILIVVIGFGACKKLNSNYDALLNTPNSPDPGVANVDLYLNAAQISFSKFYSSYDVSGNSTGASDFGAQVTRMEQMFGPTYRNAYSSEDFNDLWTNAYTGVFKNINALLPIANAKQLYHHAGVGKILKAYIMFTLVDMFGDIPYAEANLGIENTNPKADPGKAVYDSAFALLQSALVDLDKTPEADISNDLFYNGDIDKWKTLAKTLELKGYLQTRLVDEANVKTKMTALITENDLIDESSEDFTFKFGTRDGAPDTRHPKFQQNYANPGGAQDYLGNYFMWAAVQEKDNVDPRTRYYFYRQTLDIFAAIPDPVNLAFTLPCNFRVKPSADYTPYCYVDEGYIGRDHGNSEGIPPDNGYRTIWGIYPNGGEFDADKGGSTSADIGAKGAGIFPIWMSSFTDFVKAEAALTLQTPGDPKALLLSGVRKSIETVMAYPATVNVLVDDDFVPTAAQVQDYIDEVAALYDAASGTEEKLGIIIKEYYLALWGNGIESYNNYRRTAKPANIQPTIQSTSGLFIRSFFYPAVYADLNQNAIQKTATNVTVFWDTRPDSDFR